MQGLAENRSLTGSIYADSFKKQNKPNKTKGKKKKTKKMSSIAWLMFILLSASLFYSIFILERAKWSNPKELSEQTLEHSGWWMIKDPVLQLDSWSSFRRETNVIRMNMAART